MREIERDALLYVLAVSAGSADGWSFSGLGHAFVANMTGNTVLLGLGVFQTNGNLLHPLLSLCCYAVGVTLASLLTRRDSQGVVWSKAVSRTLLLEGLLIGAAAAGWALIRHGWGAGSAGRDFLSLDLLLGMVALGIGLQSGAMLQLKIPGVVTTYITGTWTTLIRGGARFVAQKERETPAERIAFEERLLMQAGVLAAYFLSAVLTGWLFQHVPSAVGALPAGTVLFAAVYGIARG